MSPTITGNHEAQSLEEVVGEIQVETVNGDNNVKPYSLVTANISSLTGGLVGGSLCYFLFLKGHTEILSPLLYSSVSIVTGSLLSYAFRREDGKLWHILLETPAYFAGIMFGAHSAKQLLQ